MGKDFFPEVEVIVSDIPSGSNAHNGNGGGGGFMSNHCQPTFRRNVHWNWTSSGQVAIVPCPSGATGLARWACVQSEEDDTSSSSSSTGADWSGVQPDMSDCKSNAMANLEVRVREEEPENVIVSTLATLTGGLRSRTGALFGGDLESAAAIMRTVANRIQYLLQTQSGSFYRKEEYIAEVFQNIVRSASNLLSRRQREAWNDLHVSRQMKVATSLLLSLEENAFLLADVAGGEEYLEEATREIGKKGGYVDTRLERKRETVETTMQTLDAGGREYSGNFALSSNFKFPYFSRSLSL
jgi:latrophilin 1